MKDNKYLVFCETQEPRENLGMSQEGNTKVYVYFILNSNI